MTEGRNPGVNRARGSLNSRFEARNPKQPDFDSERCLSCGTCIDRCPPQALTPGENDVPSVDLDRCFGCGLCAGGCPERAIALTAKPGFPVPPKTVKELGAALKGGV